MCVYKWTNSKAVQISSSTGITLQAHLQPPCYFNIQTFPGRPSHPTRREMTEEVFKKSRNVRVTNLTKDGLQGLIFP